MISMGKILDGYFLEIYLKNKRTFLSTPITEMGGKHPNPYAVFTENYIKALEKVIKEGDKTHDPE